MKQIMRHHLFACGCIDAFVQTHALITNAPHPHRNLWCLAFLFTEQPCSCEQDRDPTPCIYATLFQNGWNAGQLFAHQAFGTTDLSVYTQVGAIGGWTTHRPPRRARPFTAELDAMEANLHGEVLKSFIHGWKATCLPEHKRGV